jgi:hypothetical protein
MALACEAPVATVADNTDCDDDNALRNPGETEVCDDEDLDEDCNELSDKDDGLMCRIRGGGASEKALFFYPREDRR